MSGEEVVGVREERLGEVRLFWIKRDDEGNTVWCTFSCMGKLIESWGRGGNLIEDEVGKEKESCKGGGSVTTRLETDLFLA